MRFGAALLLCSAALLPSAAFAHDPPEIQQILFDDPRAQWVLPTNRGLVFGDPATRSFSLACPDPLGAAPGEIPPVLSLPGGRLLAATQTGLKQSHDQGCSWDAVDPFGSSTASALHADPSDGNHVYAAIAGHTQAGLYESRDAGASWSKRLSIAADDYVSQIAVAPSDPTRIYLNGLVIDSQRSSFSFQITRSTDGGKTWRRVYVPLLPDEDEAVLAAVSPKQEGDLVLIARNKRRGDRPDRALVSRDAGDHFSELLQAPTLTSAAFALDGAALIGGVDAMYRSDAALSRATAVGTAQQVTCLQRRDRILYACGHVNGFDPEHAGIFVSMDDAASWRGVMAFTDVEQPNSCATRTELCQQLWTDWQLEILVGIGGAPLDSVPGWQTFKGIDGVGPTPLRHTLSNASLSPGTGELTAPTPTSAAHGNDAASAGCMVLLGRSRATKLTWLASFIAMWPVVRIARSRNRRRAPRDRRDRLARCKQSMYGHVAFGECRTNHAHPIDHSARGRLERA